MARHPRPARKIGWQKIREWGIEMLGQEMNTLAFQIKPCPATNDHQVRIIIDGADWLDDNETLGIDPPEFFSQEALTEGGHLILGRCGCGTVGCDDITVEVERQSPGVFWRYREGVSYLFREADYDQVIRTARSDYSWEDTNRTTERVVAGVLAGTTIKGGFKFDWASARIDRGKITLSYSLDGIQKTFDYGWDGTTPESALSGAIRFKNERGEQGGL